MLLKSKILQLYHKTLKLSAALTIGGGYLVAIAPSKPAEAQTNFPATRSLENRLIYSPLNSGEINSINSNLQAQFFPEPVPFPPPITTGTPTQLPPPPTVIYGEQLPFEDNTFNQTGFSNLPYAVYINGNSPWLLTIIREIEAKSVLRKYQNRTVIQVGSFSDRFFAEDLATFFKFQGIQAQIARLNSGEKFGEAVATENSDLFPPVVQPINYGLGDTDAYYVLIPGESRNLPNIRQQVVLLGVPEVNVFAIAIPANIAVGPFYSQGDAQKWELYLQDFGGFPNAELYFGR